MNRQKALNLLGLALRAGKLVHGEASVLAAVRSKTASYVFVAADASDNTKKNFTDKTNHYDIPISFDFSREAISQAIGKDRSSVALVDQGFAKSMKKLIE